MWKRHVWVSGPFWVYWTGKTSLSFWYVTAGVCSAILCFTICFKGFIVKAKKMLESICVNYGKLKANIVSCVYLPLLFSHPTIPFSGGSLSLSLHPVENPADRLLSTVMQQEMHVFGLCTLYLMSLASFIMSLILLWTLGFRFSKISYIVVDTSCWHFYLHILSENQQPQPHFFLFCPYYPFSLRSRIQILPTKFIISMTPKIIWPLSGP